MKGKHILLGVTSSIAIYKAVDLVSRLVKLGSIVNVIMTKNATQLIQPLTFRYISRNPVAVDTFDEFIDWKPEHISLADNADIFVIAPATANIIAKLAHGIADDMLSTTALAIRCPVIIAPAMNCHMYNNPIVQENMEILKRRNFHFIEPEYGQLACGYEGKGRLAEPEKIVQEIQNLLERNQDLSEKIILVTAGPTREPFDPIRFISNRSSGKMGYAIAEAAHSRGARVILVSGPTNLSPPEGIDLINIETAVQMCDEVMKYADQADVIIMAAAVADYRPRMVSSQKLKKDQDSITIIMDKNPDILSEVAKNKHENQIIIGFSMETENLLENSIKKLHSKNLDFIVANDISKEGAGFGTDTNIVMIIDASGSVKEFPLMSKREIADLILDTAVLKWQLRSETPASKK
ncbi:MAG: bifunctional phosphopantothenoylcysteine decarboxylase/phosphopantothenate--cysteine ligase CoaBC [bacterium]